MSFCRDMPTRMSKCGKISARSRLFSYPDSNACCNDAHCLFLSKTTRLSSKLLNAANNLTTVRNYNMAAKRTRCTWHFNNQMLFDIILDTEHFYENLLLIYYHTYNVSIYTISDIARARQGSLWVASPQYFVRLHFAKSVCVQSVHKQVCYKDAVEPTYLCCVRLSPPSSLSPPPPPRCKCKT